MRYSLIVGAAAVALFGSVAAASQIDVSFFGQHGWKSDDTRDAGGTDLVGTNYTHAGKPGAVPSAAHDTAIAQQIQFVAGPAGSTYGGAVAIDSTTSNSGKSTISVIDTGAGFAAASSLLTDFEAMYEWHKSSSRTLAFRLGIQSTDWASSQAGFTATRSGESVWDLVLVHVPTAGTLGAWNSVSLSASTGLWYLYDQAGNPYYTTPNGTEAKTLDDWAVDATFGAKLFGTGATVSSIQFGHGSGQANGFSYVDYLQTNLLNGGDVINFDAAPVPLPVAALGGLALMGGMGLTRRSRR